MNRLDKAIQSDQLYEYLLGKDEYYFHPSMANLPTDPLMAFHYVEDYYTRDHTILDEIQSGIARMSADPAFSWFSLYYLYALLNFVRLRNIRTDLSGLVREVESNVLSHKTLLINDTSYEGAEWQDGLWGDTRIQSESMRSTRPNADMAEWKVNVPANGTAEVTDEASEHHQFYRVVVP